MQTLIDVSVPPLTFLLLAAVGMDLTRADFERVRRDPAIVAAGLFAPLVLLPPLAVGLDLAFRPSPEVFAGLLVVAACPIGGISNTYVYLAGASTALSVTLTALSCLFAVVTVPAVGQLIQAITGQPLGLAVPVPQLLAQLLLMLTLPVALGMWIRRSWPEVALRHRLLVQRLAFAGVGVVLLFIVLDDPGGFIADLPETIALATVFVICSSALGWLVAAVVSSDPANRFTIAVEFGTRNLGVAMAIAVTMLGRTEFARFAYTYFLTEAPLMLAAVALFRWSRSGVGSRTPV